jgi:nicotinamide mononucleotide adenylyltransferase
MAVATNGSDFDFVRRMTPEGYVFPTHRLKQTCAPGKVPLIIVACGSFSPVTLMHLRMFPMALDHAKNTGASPISSFSGLSAAWWWAAKCRLSLWLTGPL